MINIILPAFNEELTLKPLLKSIKENMEEADLKYCIFIVNDGSTDRTYQIIKNESNKMPIDIINHQINRGLAEAIKSGLLKVQNIAGERDIIITMDSDNTHSPGLIYRMVRVIREGHDVVIGSRYQRGSRVLGVPIFRRILSWNASILFRIFYPIHGVKDYTCGYRAYSASTIKEMFKMYGNEFVSQKGFSCMVDILLKMRKHNYIFGEVPLILRYDQKRGKSKMKVYSTILETLSLMIKRKRKFNPN